MWIVTTSGFLSVVKDRKDPNNLQVRARVREDILAHFPDAQVFVAHGGDYRHRAVISKADVAAKIAEMILDINYDSHFKDVAIKTSPKSSNRYAAYYGAWTSFAKMQDYAPYSKFERGKEPKIKGGSWPTNGYYHTPSQDWDRWDREDARAANARSPKGSRPFSAYDLDADEFEPINARRSSIAESAVMGEEDEEFYTQDELDAVAFYYEVSVDTLSDEKLAEYVKELNSMNMIPMSDSDMVIFRANTQFLPEDSEDVDRAEADAEADYYGGITDYSDDDSNYALPTKRKSPHWWKRIFH